MLDPTAKDAQISMGTWSRGGRQSENRTSSREIFPRGKKKKKLDRNEGRTKKNGPTAIISTIHSKK